MLMLCCSWKDSKWVCWSRSKNQWNKINKPLNLAKWKHMDNDSLPFPAHKNITVRTHENHVTVRTDYKTKNPCQRQRWWKTTSQLTLTKSHITVGNHKKSTSHHPCKKKSTPYSVNTLQWPLKSSLLAAFICHQLIWWQWERTGSLSLSPNDMIIFTRQICDVFVCVTFV